MGLWLRPGPRVPSLTQEGGALVALKKYNVTVNKYPTVLQLDDKAAKARGLTDKDLVQVKPAAKSAAKEAAAPANKSAAPAANKA
ncbi:hypothetical protein SEA_LEONA_7 [Arthrobacter phage Leona]|nr:hypothetical protein SEA_LEONA_7 [Arthrobacter phage Leona]